MKQQLWILNSSLLTILILTIIANFLLQQEPPPFQPKIPFIEERKKAKELKPEEIENIYKYDLFDTFIKAEFAPLIQKLVTPIPQPKSVPAPTPPPLPKLEFLPPLNVSLKGIAFSSDLKLNIHFYHRR